MKQREKLFNEVETVREFICLGDRVNAGGGCENAVSARTRCRWLSLGSVVSCHMDGNFFYILVGLFTTAM